MKLGIHAYAWCSEWSNKELDLIDKVKNLGMDFIELPMLNLETFDTKAIKRCKRRSKSVPPGGAKMYHPCYI